MPNQLPETQEEMEWLKRKFFNLLCFRLGGEVTITQEALEDVTRFVERTQILLIQHADKPNEFLLKTMRRKGPGEL